MRPMSSVLEHAMASRIGPVMASASTSSSWAKGAMSYNLCEEAVPCCAIFIFGAVARSAENTGLGREEEWAGLVAMLPRERRFL